MIRDRRRLRRRQFLPLRMEVMFRLLILKHQIFSKTWKKMIRCRLKFRRHQHLRRRLRLLEHNPFNGKVPFPFMFLSAQYILLQVLLRKEIEADHRENNKLPLQAQVSHHNHRLRRQHHQRHRRPS